MEKRLGRGLSSLLSAPAPEPAGPELPLASIQPNPFQPRKILEAGDLEHLRDSIANHGVLQPVVVRRLGDGYQLISGERRWRAARLAGLESIPAVIREAVTDGEMLELALVENVQRKDLNAIEKAEGYRNMMESLGLTQEAVAAKVGLRRSSVANHLRLLELPPEVREAVARHAISMGHAKALLGLPMREDRISLMEETVREDLSVRELERQVRTLQGQSRAATRESGGKEGEPRTGNAPSPLPWVKEIEERLRKSLETKIQVQDGPGDQGRIIIDYFDHEHLDRLLQKLAPRTEV